MVTKKRVLVVDDEAGILRFVKTILELSGFEVIATTNGEEALKTAQSQPVDMVILDVLMQPMSGFELLERLRSFSQAPVIMFTAQRDISEMAIKVGANGYLEKPFKPDQLLQKIREVLGS